MPKQLTWNDLIIQNISENDSRLWLGYWSRVVNSEVAPVFMSKFGDWYLRRPDGSTDELSVIELSYKCIASSPAEFTALVNTQEWQEEHLLSQQVLELHKLGKIPNDGLCYGFSPHPIWSGAINLDQVMLMDIGTWQNICAQTRLKQKN